MITIDSPGGIDMIHFLQFEEQEQRNWGSGQRLAQELASRNRPPPATVTQLTRIFAAFMGALFLALCFLFLQNDTLNSVVGAHPPLMFAQMVFFAGILFALAVVLFTGIPLAVVAWRSTPSVRFFLVMPFVAFVLPLFLSFFVFNGPVGILSAVVLLAVFIWRSKQRTHLLLVIPFLAFVLLFLPRGMQPGGPSDGPVFPIMLLGTFLFASTLLAAAVWRAIPRMRIVSTLLFLVFGLGFLSLILVMLSLLLPDGFIGPLGHIVNLVFSYPIPLMGNLGNVILLLILGGFPVLTTIAINHAIQQAALPEKWLRFARLPSRLVAFALLVMFMGLLSWGVYLAVFAPALLFSLNFPLLPTNPWLSMLVGMLICVVISVRAFSEKR
jgi:hypothetical protein